MSTMVIDGKPASARSGATVEIHDPATGERVDTVPQAGVEETRQAIDAAHAAFRGWADTLPQKRAQILMKGAALARQHLDEVATLLTREQGKPLRDSKIEAERFVENIEYYAMLSASGAIRGKHVQLSVPGAFGLVVRRPLGVVGAIIPWNFPLTLLANKIAPALAVGNTVVAKPASTTPLSTIRLVELMNEGGLPPGVLNVVVGPGAVVGQELIKNPKVRKIGFTGETKTGKQVMAEAASDLKHVTLELGGSDPAIVCDDADVEMAGKAIAIGRFFNCGQACLAVKRVFVHEAVADQLIEKVTARAKRLKVSTGSTLATAGSTRSTWSPTTSYRSAAPSTVGSAKSTGSRCWTSTPKRRASSWEASSGRRPAREPSSRHSAAAAQPTRGSQRTRSATRTGADGRADPGARRCRDSRRLDRRQRRCLQRRSRPA